jgi:hypothetical protein
VNDEASIPAIVLSINLFKLLKIAGIAGLCQDCASSEDGIIGLRASCFQIRRCEPGKAEYRAQTQVKTGETMGKAAARFDRKTIPVVYVIASDWTMRTAVRAELREMGIEALGMDSAEDAGRAMASGQIPNVIVLEATEEFLGDLRIQNLVRRFPAVMIASRTVKVSLPDTADVLYRPVRIAEIVARVSELLARHTA